MPKEKKESIEIKEISAPVPPLAPLFANLVSITGHPDMVLLDFGFYAPSYKKPYGVEDTQVARFCIPWDTAKDLVDSLNESISEHNLNLKNNQNSNK
jgi:hypothetical protein